MLFDLEIKIIANGKLVPVIPEPIETLGHLRWIYEFAFNSHSILDAIITSSFPGHWSVTCR